MAEPLARITPEYCIDIVREYPFPVDRVWDAVTTAEGISAWMKYEATLDRRLGGRIFVDFKSEGNLEGTVCEWVPERVFAYSWGLSVVRWVLEPCEGGTRLHFTNSHVTPDILMGFSAGWHAFIDHLGRTWPGLPWKTGMTISWRSMRIDTATWSRTTTTPRRRRNDE